MSSEWENRFNPNQPLKNLTTFGVGGPANYCIEISDIADMQDLLPYCKKRNLPYFILGKGSNVLFNDQGFHGVVILNRIQFVHEINTETWHVGAGFSFSLLGSQTARKGLTGLEFASGIPGSVGGAVFMNAGANGRETSQCLISVDYVTEDGELVKLEKKDLLFSYRHSSFQQMPGAIVGAIFQLRKASEARDRQLNMIGYRKKTQPYDAKSAGCIFRNPVNEHAGALIEKCGLKGKSIGGAQVSPLHANFVVNTGDASAQDILNLIEHIRETVKNITGFDLETEVRYIPYSPIEEKAIHG